MFLKKLVSIHPKSHINLEEKYVKTYSEFAYLKKKKKNHSQFNAGI